MIKKKEDYDDAVSEGISNNRLLTQAMKEDPIVDCRKKFWRKNTNSPARIQAKYYLRVLCFAQTSLSMRFVYKPRGEECVWVKENFATLSTNWGGSNSNGTILRTWKWQMTTPISPVQIHYGGAELQKDGDQTPHVTNLRKLDHWLLKELNLLKTGAETTSAFIWDCWGTLSRVQVKPLRQLQCEPMILLWSRPPKIDCKSKRQ